MPDLLGWIVLVGGALAGSVVGGVAGFGAGVILLPLVAWTLGFRAVVPVLTVTMFLGNLSRVWWSRRDVDGAVIAGFLAGAVPATALGAVLYAGVTNEWLGRIIGGFLIAAVPLRRAGEEILQGPGAFLLAGAHLVRLARRPRAGERRELALARTPRDGRRARLVRRQLVLGLRTQAPGPRRRRTAAGSRRAVRRGRHRARRSA